MTTATTEATTATEMQTFILAYKVITCNNVQVERPANISKEDLIASISKDEISCGECEVSWDDIKYSWQDDDVITIYDEDFNEVFS